MKWILFVLITNFNNGQSIVAMQEFGGAQTCADAAIEVEKRINRNRVKAWCMPKDKREAPARRSSWM